MPTEVLAWQDRLTHATRLSWWDKRAIALCGKSFPDKTYRDKMIYGGVDCPECKHAKRLGKRP